VSELLAVDDPTARERATDLLRKGQVVVLPTDSVYGLAADAFSQVGMQRLFGAKRRGRNTPVTVVIRSPRQTTGLVEAIAEPAERLMAAYWPGPLTLVFRAVPELNWDIGAAAGSVSLRIPRDDLLLDLVGEVGPLAVTSANHQGKPVPTTAAQAQRQLGLAAALYLDGGERNGPTSTVVDVTRGSAEVLREGAIPAAHVEQVATGRLPWGDRPTGVSSPEAAAGGPHDHSHDR
jgi:tRNA threonylcarbamoyl adenosine modification protein (Sua5/YciO/YrdC/YwlC family)